MMVPVDKWKAKEVYLKRAIQYATSMNNSFDRGDWDACVSHAVHCVISVQDALCVHRKGERYKGINHMEAATLFKNLIQSDDHQKAARRVFDLFRMKTDAEYGDRAMTTKEAGIAKLHAERFLSYVQAVMGT